MFGARDETEEAYRADKLGKFVEKENLDGPSKAELMKITVANPLGLMEDDPLMIEAKKESLGRKAQAKTQIGRKIIGEGKRRTGQRDRD